MKSLNIFHLIALIAMIPALSSCDDSKSYAELLTDENRVVNSYLAEFRVVDDIPADSIFETGTNAPYYKMDEDGNVYMQVIDAGDPKSKPESNDRVYFRYMRYSLYDYEIGGSNNIGVGNADNMASASTFFLLDNIVIQQSTQYGAGIQVPMHYLGYNAKVNLVIKSQQGPSSEIANVVPFLYEVSYYKSMI